MNAAPGKKTPLRSKALAESYSVSVHSSRASAVFKTLKLVAKNHQNLINFKGSKRRGGAAGCRGSPLTDAERRAVVEEFMRNLKYNIEQQFQASAMKDYKFPRNMDLTPLSSAGPRSRVSPESRNLLRNSAFMMDLSQASDLSKPVQEASEPQKKSTNTSLRYFRQLLYGPGGQSPAEHKRVEAEHSESNDLLFEIDDIMLDDESLHLINLNRSSGNLVEPLSRVVSPGTRHQRMSRARLDQYGGGEDAQAAQAPVPCLPLPGMQNAAAIQEMLVQ